jgi:hypothetical protein
MELLTLGLLGRVLLDIRQRSTGFEARMGTTSTTFKSVRGQIPLSPNCLHTYLLTVLHRPVILVRLDHPSSSFLPNSNLSSLTYMYVVQLYPCLDV